jgi:quercetin dioxygenase-like cupin family protein
VVSEITSKEVIYREDGGGRSYALGAMYSVFKADGAETANAYSISEWWLDAHSPGPGAHSHDAHDDIFYVLEGNVTFILDGERIEAGKGAFVRVPAGIEHDYQNNGDDRAGFLNIYIPGGFEQDMPAIVSWFDRQANSVT